MKAASTRSSDVHVRFHTYVSAGKNSGLSYREIAFQLSRQSGRFTSYNTIQRWMLADYPDVAAVHSLDDPRRP